MTDNMFCSLCIKPKKIKIFTEVFLPAVSTLTKHTESKNHIEVLPVQLRSLVNSFHFKI